MSVQSHETDILQEHTDSTSILIARLDQWRQGVHVVHHYASGYLSVHQATTHQLEKTLKNLTDVPTFTGGAGTEAASETQLSNVFHGLQQHAAQLQQRSASTAAAIKSGVLPPLESLSTEIEKHYKTLKHQGAKGAKEVEKSRGETQKLVEHLGQVTSSYGSRSLTAHEDPYIIHRKTGSAVSEQVGRENTQAEAALSVQKSFAQLETQVVQTMRQALGQLASLNEGYDNSELETNTAVSSLFNSINLDAEWKLFTRANRDQLVPDQGFQRDPNRVTFMNKHHVSTQPVIQGLLNRKGTVLKNYSQSFYVISPAGYMYQFKNAEDVTPELSLFLPECQVSRNTTDFTFKVVGKDAAKTIATRHKYTFRANSARELDAWFAAISRITGTAGVEEDSDEPQSPVEPVQAVPAQAVPAQAVPAQAVPAQTVPAQAVPAQGVSTQGVPTQGVPTQAQHTIPVQQTASSQGVPVQQSVRSQPQSPVEPPTQQFASTSISQPQQGVHSAQSSQGPPFPGTSQAQHAQQFTQEPKHIGQQFSQEPQHLGQQFSQEPKHIGQQFSQEPKHIGQQFSQEPKHIGQQFSQEPAHLGQQAQSSAENSAQQLTKPAQQFSQQAQQAPGHIAQEFKPKDPFQGF